MIFTLPQNAIKIYNFSGSYFEQGASVSYTIENQALGSAFVLEDGSEVNVDGSPSRLAVTFTNPTYANIVGMGILDKDIVVNGINLSASNQFEYMLYLLADNIDGSWTHFGKVLFCNRNNSVYTNDFRAILVVLNVNNVALALWDGNFSTVFASYSPPIWGGTTYRVKSIVNVSVDATTGNEIASIGLRVDSYSGTSWTNILNTTSTPVSINLTANNLGREHGFYYYAKQYSTFNTNTFRYDSFILKV